MGNEHCPICGADAETPDKAFFYYECGFTVNRQSGAVIRHCKNEELVEANKRIAALEAENAALRSRLEFTSCQKADVEAQVLELEEQNAALRRDAAAWLAVLNMPPRAKLQRYADDEGWTLHTYDISGGHFFYDGSTPRAALVAAGLMENTDGTD